MLKPDGFRLAHPAVAEFLFQAFAHLNQIIALVGFVVELDIAAVRLQIAKESRPRERIHLSPAVIHVVLAMHPESRELEEAAEGVAEHRAAGVAHMERTRRIRRDEFKVDRQAFAGLRPAVTKPLLERRAHFAHPNARLQLEVQKPGTGDFNRNDPFVGPEFRRQFFSELAGISLRRSGDRDRCIGREFAMRLMLGPFDGDIRKIDVRRNQAFIRELSKRINHHAFDVGENTHSAFLCKAASSDFKANA